jgi:hypothetical protein
MSDMKKSARHQKTTSDLKKSARHQKNPSDLKKSARHQKEALNIPYLRIFCGAFLPMPAP